MVLSHQVAGDGLEGRSAAGSVPAGSPVASMAGMDAGRPGRLGKHAGRWVTAAEAMQAIQSGDTVVLGHCCGEAQTLLAELAKRNGELRNVRIVDVLFLGDPFFCRPEYAGSFHHVSLFAGPKTRAPLNDGLVDFMPCFFNEVPSLWGREIPVDVALVTVSLPDADGFCSLGVAVDYTRRAVEVAHTVIAEVNSTMPRIPGDCMVHVSDIDYLVETDRPIITVGRAVASEDERLAGENVAALIEDGATLQLGIGAMPEVVCSRLVDRRDLGVHSEMISDGVMELVERGVITGARKTLHPGKIIATFIMGSRKLYDWLDLNPMMEMHPVSYTNNAYVIGQNRNMVSVNAALEVDLLGQVCADTLGTYQFSGVGGQVDFVRGARLSEGGKAVIVLTSTARNGEVSRIVPMLKPGATVTTSRNDVDYIVTEYGAARLHGLTARERIGALIGIAHPKFRDDLARQAAETFRWC
jgi:4-hydroxybutyrate CoA-transferase